MREASQLGLGFFQINFKTISRMLRLHQREWTEVKVSRVLDIFIGAAG